MQARLRPAPSPGRPPQTALGAHFFRVPDLVACIRDLLAADPVLSDVWVSGEIAELTQSAAGHIYFTIRDGGARIPAVMFRSAARRQTLPLSDGYWALVHGAVGIYDQRSVYQLVADVVLPGDAGVLRAQFEALRLRLEQEGLFASERKRPLPTFPRRIGVVTSDSGAVIHDMMHIWQRRYPALDIILAPSAVQGEEAPRALVAALARLVDFHATQPLGEGLDAIILARGGGSPDELASFNDERVARAIFGSPVPVVSAVGHETDYTIADLVADVRAPTPSAAAELLTPDEAELRKTVDSIAQRMRLALQRQLIMARAALNTSRQQLARRSPARLVDEHRRRVDDALARGTRAARALMALERSRIAACTAQLAALSPLTTLSRGYAIASRADDGAVLTDALQATVGQRIAVRLARGRLVGEVLGREIGGVVPGEATHGE